MLRKIFPSLCITNRLKSSNDNPLVTGGIISPIDDDDAFGLRQTLSKPARRLRRKMQLKPCRKLFRNNTFHTIKTKQC